MPDTLEHLRQRVHFVAKSRAFFVFGRRVVRQDYILEALEQGGGLPADELPTLDAIFVSLADLPALLARTRKDRGLSVREVAEAVGLSRVSVRNIERGRSPSWATVRKVWPWIVGPDVDETRGVR